MMERYILNTIYFCLKDYYFEPVEHYIDRFIDLNKRNVFLIIFQMHLWPFPDTPAGPQPHNRQISLQTSK
jgi:hypothetical protein